MNRSRALYRGLVRLYPAAFRARYGDDLVQHFADLVRDRGLRGAWARTALDLIVTVPRYRLEGLMSEDRTPTALTAVIVALAAAGVVTFLMGLAVGLVLVLAAAAVAASQASRLGRAIRTTVPNRRRRRFRIAAGLGVVSLAALASYTRAVGDEQVSGLSLVLHNAVGVPAMVGAVVYAVLALLTPRRASRPPVVTG